MKKKGFTLIELLAVIIILAVIALIATPIVLNVVDNARKSAFQRSASGYYDAARYLYDELYLKNDRQSLSFNFVDGEQISSNENYQLKVKGQVPKGGLVYLTSDGQITVSIHNGKYCANVGNDGKVTLSENINDCMDSITPIPASCYSIKKEPLSTENNLDGSEAWMTADYNMLYYDRQSSECPKEIGTLLIPDEVNGEKVEGIGISAFAYDDSSPINAKHVIIPSGVKVIDNRAFANMPWNVNWDGAVERFISASLSEGLLYIGSYAFSYDYLKNITIPDSVIEIGAAAFENNNLDNITLGESLKYIGNSSFSYNQITSIELPNNVIKIDNYAFTNNQITGKLIIPNSVIQIGMCAFESNQLIGIEIPDNNINIEFGVFRFNHLTSVNIPNSVTNIADYTFFGNQLTSITIPNTVISIGQGAFNNNQLPDEQAFIYQRNSDGSIDNTVLIGYGGARRENVIIPENITTILDYAFYANHLIGDMIIPDTVTTMGNGVFDGNEFNTLTIGSGITSISKDMFAASTTIENLIIGNHNKNLTISSEAFKNQNFQSLTIGQAVNKIENNAFQETTIKQLTIDSKTTEINGAAFSGSTIDKAIIGNNTEGNIIVRNFYGLKLKELVLGNSVTAIDEFAFDSNQLTNITIPSTVIKIGAGAFNNNQLSDDQAFIYKRNSDGTEDKTTIVSYGGAKRDSVITPVGVEIIGVGAFFSDIQSLTISEGVKRIEPYACSDFYTLESLTLPNSLEYIGEGAFEGQLLTNITIPASVTTIENYAFEGNSFSDANAIRIEGNATRFDNIWTDIGFPAK